MDLTAPGPDPLELALQRELRAGERVLWRGRRLPRVAWGSLAIWLFAIPWTAFSLFWTTMAFAGAQAFEGEAGVLGYAFPLFGTPFIAVGLAMLAAPFLPLFGARRTLFAVTDQRLLRIYRGRRLKTRSVGGASIGRSSVTSAATAAAPSRLSSAAIATATATSRSIISSLARSRTS